ncbi:MAG: SDR family NAD(P)-dependent oxidoreductase [Microthrixaceae bacterium]
MDSSTAASANPQVRLEGERVLVTGAAQGVGATTARRIATEGGAVVLADINEVGVADVASELVDAGHCANAIGLDVTDARSWSNAIAEAVGEMGGLTALVNNAAILHLGVLEDMEPSHIESLLRVNLLGPTLGIRAATAALRDNGGGSIVNIASVAGLEGRNATVVYSASKWGVRGLTKAAAMELGRFGIRVNAVCPSMGNPDMFAPFVGEFDFDEFTRTSPEPALVQRGRPRETDMDDVAAMVAWLISGESTMCTGADFVVDAGWTAGSYIAGMPGWEQEARRASVQHTDT